MQDISLINERLSKGLARYCMLQTLLLEYQPHIYLLTVHPTNESREKDSRSFRLAYRRALSLPCFVMLHGDEKRIRRLG